VLKDRLEIFIITYNRKSELQETFKQILADASPIKDLTINVLDNASTDGSSEMIDEYCAKFPNLKHIRNNRNIGGNANAIRAYELSSKEYVWVLCDDDEYNWDGWSEVEQLIESDCDAIIVTSHKNPEQNIVQKICAMTYTPGVIYKTENITSTVIVNGYYLVYSFFPQMALALNLVNNNKDIRVVKKNIVKPRPVPIDTTYTYTRGLDNNKSLNMSNTIWGGGMLNALNLLRDRTLKNEIIDGFIFNGRKEMDPSFLVSFNRKAGNNSLKNLTDAFCEYSVKDKFRLLYWIVKNNKDLLLSCYKTEEGVYLKFFNSYNIKIIPLKLKKETMIIPVCFVTDDNYARYMAVSMLSAIKNAAKNVKYAFYILCNDLSDDVKSKLKQICNNKADIEFVDTIKYRDKLENLKQKAAHISKTSYAKFLIPELLPHLDKVIYLDCDIVITGSLEKLYMEDISGYLLGAVEDIGYTYWSRLKDELKLKFLCINSGVMLINCKEWRNQNVASSLFECAKDPDKIGFGQDQPVINYVLKNKIRFLDLQYNVQDAFLRNGVEITSRYDKEKCQNAIKKPIVIHYTGNKKPWNNTGMCYANVFWKYYLISPFMSSKLKKRFFKEQNLRCSFLGVAIKKQWLENVFSIKNTNQKKHKTIIILGIKIRFKRRKLTKKSV